VLDCATAALRDRLRHAAEDVSPEENLARRRFELGPVRSVMLR